MTDKDTMRELHKAIERLLTDDERFHTLSPCQLVGVLETVKHRVQVFTEKGETPSLEGYA